MLEKGKKKNLTIGLSKHRQKRMEYAIKNLRFYFVKAMALKLVKPEDQYKSDLKFINTYQNWKGNSVYIIAYHRAFG